MSRRTTAVIQWRDNYRAIFGPLAESTADAWLIYIRANVDFARHNDPVRLLDQAMANLCDNWHPSHMNEKPGVRDLLRAVVEVMGGGEAGKDPWIKVADGMRPTARRLSDLQSSLRRANAADRFDIICTPYDPEHVDLLRNYCLEQGLMFTTFVPPKPFWPTMKNLAAAWRSPMQPEAVGA